MSLALVARALEEPDAELQALQGALTADPYDLLALLAKGQCLERLARGADALAAYRAACTVASEANTETLGADLRRMLSRAQSVVNREQRALAEALDSLVAQEGSDLQGHARDRFVQAVDLLLGRRRRFDPQPMGLFYPQLMQAEFFPRERFPWLSELEQQTSVIRAELDGVLAQGTGFEPYLQYDADQPLAQWGELNKNPRWNAFHLLKDGLPVSGNVERCPRTMAVLAPLPQPRQEGRTPVAMFSCLQPQTRIPPHVGVSNARLLVHLPLIVPPACGFRVGSQTREWRLGEAFVFDDSVEHEAWNLSDELRVVLIFDIWHPDLTPPEQRMLDALARVKDLLRKRPV